MKQITIILIHVGTQSLPSYFGETLKIIHKIAQKSRIIFLADEANRNNFEVIYQKLDKSGPNIQFVPIEGFPESTITKNFRCNTTLDRNFREGFWFNALNRFLVLADYMSHSGVEDVVHLENDYVLYFDPTDKREAFISFADFAVPVDRTRAIPGIVWIRNSRVSQSLARHISESPDLDDMASLGQFCFENTEVRSRPLPTLPYSYSESKGLDLQKYSSSIDLFGGIFDAAAVGQYIGGIHWMNNPVDTTFFINEQSDLNVNELSFSWEYKNNIRQPCLIFKGEKSVILGMHAHSKNLEGLSPFNHGIPRSENDVVTGERLQALCELTLTSSSITKFHGRDNIQSHEVLELLEDAEGNLIAPTIEMIEAVSRAKSIFVYTHLLPYFKYYLAPRINSPFTLVTHNSDHSVTVMDFQLLNHPYLKNWYAQNCEFSHTRLKPLPIGLENKQWGPEKIEQLVEASKDNFKSDLIYVNFSTGTHPSRLEAMIVSRSLQYATIETGVSYQAYLKSMAKHKFCICPRGNGVDTHRFWEAQYLNCIPVILWRDWTAAYSEMPVLILDNWNELKELDLDRIYITLTNKNYLRGGLSLDSFAYQIHDD